MSGFTPFADLNVLTAAQLNALLPAYVIKQANQSVTSSTTLVNDSELVYALTAGRTYHVRCGLIANGATGGDIKVAWATTGTISMLSSRSCTGPGVSTATTADTTARVSASQTGLTTAFSYGTDGTLQTGITEEFIVTCTVGGNLQLQWAQNASSGTATTVGSGSWILLIPIS